MEIQQERWVKPFSTGMSCIDTVTGECERGLSVDECRKVCEDSPRCNYGYHVKLPNENQSYCLPLNGFAHWGNNNIFRKSTIVPQSSPILSRGLGVNINVFQNEKMLDKDQLDRNRISQLGIYVLRYVVDEKNPDKDLYMMPDFSFENNPNNAVQLLVFRDLPVSSSISTVDEKVRNGQVVFLKNHNNNNVFMYIKEDTYGFYPYTIRWSSSSIFDVSELYHTQLVSAYPFTSDFINVDESFAVRVARIPVDDSVLYWDVDPTLKQLVFRKVMRKDMGDVRHLDNFKRFKLEQQDEIDIVQAENFVSSQVEYLLTTFYSVLRRKKWSILTIMLILLIILHIIRLILQRK